MDNFIRSLIEDQGLPSSDIRTESLSGDGSQRRFLRIIPCPSDRTFIMMLNPPSNDFLKKENNAYLNIGKHLHSKGLPVPEIYRFNPAEGWFILEDLGDRNLQNAAMDNEDRIILYEKVLEILFRFQIEGSDGFLPEWCCQTATYDHFVMHRFESDYFRDSFLSGYLGMDIDLIELEGSFNHLAKMASITDNKHFLHRDFQSRNILIIGNRIGIIDWQGGRLGPLAYDLASLLIDPYVGLSHREQDHLFSQYLSLLKRYRAEWVKSLTAVFPYLAIQRNLQILGAFSYLTKIQGKTFFQDYISPALKSLHHLLDETADPGLSLLTDIVNSLISDKQYQGKENRNGGLYFL